MSVRILVGECRESLAQLEANSVQCCVTSPPYFGLRDYGHAGQLGLESTPAEYVEKMVAVFREVKRVLRDDGTLWLNIGDSYAARYRQSGPEHAGALTRSSKGVLTDIVRDRPEGLKEKDLIGIPWMLAFALRADGWYLRSDIIWHKPNPMPESVTDRPTKSHEYLFLLSKSTTYYYDAEAIAEPITLSSASRLGQPTLPQQEGSARVPGKTNGNMKAVAPRFGGMKYGDNEAPEHRTKSGDVCPNITGRRNARTVWTIATQPYSGAHFATFPPALIEPCIKAGSKEGDTVLDPFFGAGTTGLVADRLGRDCIGCELNPEYAELARKRIYSDNPLFTDVA
jgi:DNA modification methylase